MPSTGARSRSSMGLFRATSPERSMGSRWGPSSARESRNEEQEVVMESSQQPATDRRHHVQSLLMRESLLDKQVMSSTETPVVRMLANCHVIKVGGRSIIDGGKESVYPLVEAIGVALSENKLIIGVDGGVRSRHTYSIGIDLGLPTGVLASWCSPTRWGTLTCSAPSWRRMAWWRPHQRSSVTSCRSSCRLHPESSSMAIRPTPCGSIPHA